MSKKNKKKRPVILKVGAPEWMVTFGDLMSLLLTFFVLLFSISEIKDEKIFDMVIAFRTEFDMHSDSEGSFLLEFAEVSEMLSTMSLDFPDKAEGRQGKSTEVVENPFGKYATVSQVKDDFHINIEGSVLFEPGSSEIQPEGKEFVREMSRRLRGGYNRLRVVGTAAPGIADQDHVLLGFQRARNVRDLLIAGDESGGVDDRRIDIATRGAMEPLTLPQLVDPDRRSERDRVVVIMTPEPVEGLAETNNAGRPVERASTEEGTSDGR